MTEKTKAKWSKYLTYALYVFIIMNFSSGVTHIIAQIGIAVDLILQALVHAIYLKKNQLDEDEAAAGKKSARVFLIAAVAWMAYILLVPMIVPYF